MSIVIHHNPDCGTSRKVLEIVRSTGVEPTVVEYLREGWTRPQLLALFAAAGLMPSTALRTKRSPAEELGLLEDGVDEQVIFEQMLEHPVLVNRPIVCSPKGVRLCRPAESVVPLLDPPPGWQLETSEADPDGTSPAVEAASLVPDLDSLPGLDRDLLAPIDGRQLAAAGDQGTPPKILVLYGSNRERSYSRFVAHEVIRLLHYLGAEAQLFDPRDLPLPDSQDADHPKVVELRDLATWSEGMAWISPERHGAMTSVLKAQIDWIPLSLGGVRPTQGKTLALFQICGGSQSFNTVNQLRILGRWMRMVTIPNQSSVPKAFLEFDDAGRMTPSPYYRRIVDVVEELVRFTYLVRGRSEALLDRYSERVESHEELSRRVNQKEL